MKRRYRAKERERLVDAVLKTGTPIKDAAAHLGVKAATAYYWVKRARQKQRPQFAMVVPATQGRVTTLRLEVGEAIIHVESGFDADLLRTVVSALSRRSA